MAKIPWEKCLSFVVVDGVGRGKDLMGTLSPDPVTVGYPVIANGTNGLPSLDFKGTASSRFVRSNTPLNFSGNDKTIVVLAEDNATGYEALLNNQDIPGLPLAQIDGFCFCRHAISPTTWMLRFQCGFPAGGQYLTSALFNKIAGLNIYAIKQSARNVVFSNNGVTWNLSGMAFTADYVNSARPVTFGWGNGTGEWNGRYQYCIIFDCALTDAELKSVSDFLWNGCFPMPIKPLLFQGGTKTISQWSDVSGNNNTFLQPVAGEQPVISANTGPNNKTGLYFAAGKSMYSSIPNNSLKEEFSITVGMKYNRDASTDFALCRNCTSEAALNCAISWIFYTSGGATSMRIRLGQDGGVTMYSNDIATPKFDYQYSVATLGFSFSKGMFFIMINDTLLYSYNSVAFKIRDGNLPYYIGSPILALAGGQGYVYDYIINNGYCPSMTEVASLHKMIMNKVS